jgi:hypothetical protein
MAIELSRLLSTAQQNDLKLAISGANSAVTKRVILGALSLTEGPLPKLKLAFIGDVSDAEAVRESVEALRGQFFFAEAS